MRQVSKKRARQLREYAKKRKLFLEQNPYCKVCGAPADQIHHKKGRENELLLNEDFWLPVDFKCHRKIEDNPQWAKEKGYSINRTRTMKEIYCFVVKSHREGFGWGNGYIVLPMGHKYHGVDYDEIPVDAHGGLTFSDHVNSLQQFKETEPEYEGGWAIGFDTMHFGDDLVRWPNAQSVMKECIRIKKQLIDC